MKVFRDKGFRRPPRQRLPQSDWLEAIKVFPRVCVDIIMMDETGQECHLPYRIIPPKHHQRWVVGGSVFPGEGPKAAARRIFHEDTGLKLVSKRFKSLELVRYLVTGPPSFDAYTFLFAVHLTREERQVAVSNLESREYDPEKGLKMFNTETIKIASLDPYVLFMFKKARRKKKGA